MASTACRLDIYNMALGYIGTRTISSPNEQTPEAIVCELYWDRARRAALRDYPYNFASRRVLLAQKEMPSQYAMQWGYAYGLPESCLKVVHVHDGAHPQTPFRIVQNGGEVVILSNVGAAYCDYTIDVEDITLWDELFVDAMARKLASMIATPLLKNNPQKQQQLEELYRLAIPSANGQDASEVELDRSAGNVSSWLMSRGGGASWDGLAPYGHQGYVSVPGGASGDQQASAEARAFAEAAAASAAASEDARELACGCASRAEQAARDAETSLSTDVGLCQDYAEAAAGSASTAGQFASEALEAESKVQQWLQELGTDVGDHSYVTAEDSTEARTLSDRFADIVNVLDYGAKGDGETDDTAAVQAALDAASASNKVLWFPAGTYLLATAQSVECDRYDSKDVTRTALIRASLTHPLSIIGDQAVLKAAPDPSSPVNVTLDIDTIADLSISGIHVDNNDLSECGMRLFRPENKSFAERPYADLTINGVTIENTWKFSDHLTDSACLVIGEFRSVVVDGINIDKCVAADDALSLGNVGVYGLTIGRFANNGTTGYASNIVQLNNIVVEDVYCEDDTYTSDQDAIRIFSNYKTADAKINLDTCLVENVYCRNIRGRIAKCQTHHVTFDNCVLENDHDGAGFHGIAQNRAVIENQGGTVSVNNLTVIDRESHVCQYLVRASAVVALVDSDPNDNNDRSYAGIPYQGGSNLSNIKAILIPMAEDETDFTSLFSPFVFNVHDETGATVSDTGLGGEYIFNISGVNVVSSVSCNSFAFFARNIVTRKIIFNVSDCVCPCSNTFLRVGGGTLANVKYNMVNVVNTSGTDVNAYTPDYAEYASLISCYGFLSGDALGMGFSAISSGSTPGKFTSGTKTKPSVAYMRGYVSGTDTNFAYFGTGSSDLAMLYATAFAPIPTNTLNLGLSNRLWKEIFCSNATINTSDERKKSDIAAIPDAVLDAWGEVGWAQYRFKDALAEKGETARIHSGLIAQRIDAAFKSHGLDANRYGLFCHDEWDDQYVVREDGTTELVAPGGDAYGVRYAEALCMEAAYQRRRAERAEARIASIEARVAVLESSLS